MNCPAAAAVGFVLDKGQQEDFLCLCRGNSQISDALILNTCNRLEFYFYAKKYFDITSLIGDFISNGYWNKYKQSFNGIDVAEHLFNVAAGLESQIVGENEIFSQLKSAYSFALGCETITFMFHHLLHSAFRVAKAVKTETDISSGALSLAGAAVALAAVNREIEKARVFVIGSGANAELVVKHLTKKKVRDITIVARKYVAATKFLPLNQLPENIANADIVFTATSARQPLINADMIKKRSNPLVLIDLSVPSNIEQGVKDCDNVKLFNIDSLNEIISVNNQKRKCEVPKAQAVINRHLPAFSNWLENLDMVSMVD